MRRLIYILFNCFLMSVIHGQNNDKSYENWNSIVGYVNVKMTECYLQDLLDSDNLNNKDKEYYLVTLKPKLVKSTIDNPITFDSLENYLTPNFEKTLSNFSLKVNQIKSGPKELDSLFNSIEVVFIGVKKENLINSEPMNKLRIEITDYVPEKSSEEVIEISTFQEANMDVIQKRGETIFTLSNI